MFIKEAWFWRGFQSALFYYISCAPCTKVLDQRKKKQNAARAKADKAARRAAQAELEEGGAEPQYDHPLPSSTNPFWEEEMKLGPGPPSKRRNNRHHAGGIEGYGRGRKSKEKDRKKSEALEVAQAKIITTGTTNINGSSKGTSGSDMTVGSHTNAPEVAQDDLYRSSDTDWNRQRYQREDELLWGLEVIVTDKDTGTAGATGRGGVPLSRTPSSGRGQGSYYYARNPAVNDLHPPVVSTAPKSRAETQWMLQPPPRAKIMEGKEREHRSRSGTGSAYSSRASSKRPSLGRQLSNRVVDPKMKWAGAPAGNGGADQSTTHLGVDGAGMSRSRASSNQSFNSTSSRRRNRDPTPRSHPSPNALQPSRSISRRRGASGATLPPPLSMDTEPDMHLQLIPSTTLVLASKRKNDGKEDEILNLPSLLLKGTSSPSKEDPKTTVSHNILQELVPPPNQINRSSSLNARGDSTRTKSPSAIREEDRESWQFPDAEDGWASSNGGEWAREGPRHRWSMDI